MVSGGEPFTEGRPDDEKGNDKVIIVLTDGANTYGDLGSTDDAGNKSTYAAYGYVGKKFATSEPTTRLFKGTSNAINKTELFVVQLHGRTRRTDAEGLLERQDGRRAGDDGVARSQRIEQLREEGDRRAQGLFLGFAVPQGT